jgi:hypothetical protein
LKNDFSGVKILKDGEYPDTEAEKEKEKENEEERLAKEKARMEGIERKM